MAKKNLFTTPRGVAQYPWLNTADTQYDAAGKYKCNLRVAVADAKELMEQLKAAATEEFGSKAKTARMPFKVDQETGEVVFSASSKYQPRFVDTTGQLIEEGQAPQIYGGSTLKLAGSLYCYNSGGAGIVISLQLSGVQVIDLAPPKSVQFEAEEGGFVAANDNGGEKPDDGEVQYNF